MQKETKKRANIFVTLLVLLSCDFLLNGCGRLSLQNRIEIATNIANNAAMNPEHYNVRGFDIMSWKKPNITDNKTVTIYIEGDGLAWLTKNQPSLNPTPINPVALRLATQDTSDNVIYLARPCQYSDLKCSARYWTTKRFAKDVIDAYDQLLSQLKTNNHYVGFHLVGYSGGASIAALVSAQRDDILSFRSVAGNLDNEYFTHIHNVSPMTDSLDPINIAPQLSHVPQIHFVGVDDVVIPPSIATRWQKRTGSQCSRIIYVQQAEHQKGWDLLWPKLITEQAACKN